MSPPRSRNPEEDPMAGRRNGASADRASVPMTAAAVAEARPIDTAALLNRLKLLQLETARPDPVQQALQPLLRCAATLDRFDPHQLLRAHGRRADRRLLAALAAHCEGPDAGPDAAGGTASASASTAARTGAAHADGPEAPSGRAARGEDPLWRLTPAARATAVRAAGSAQRLREARQQAGPLPQPVSLLQQQADALLLGPPPVLDQLGMASLAALLQARGWYAGRVPDLPPLPEADALQARLAQEQLLEPMRRLVGRHFVGRTAELARLADYVGVLPPQALLGSKLLGRGRRFVRQARLALRERPPLFISGPGGVGKSSLLARFILDHVRPPGGDGLPFVLLDFDRARIEAQMPLTLLAAALAQLAVQFPEHAMALQRMTEQVDQQLRSADKAEVSKADGLQTDVLADFARQVDEMLGGADNPTPLLWVLDTFEEAQRLGHSIAMSLWHFMNDLQQRLPRLRLVVCGRVLPPDLAWEPVPLDEFDEPSARAYLRQRLAEIDAADKGDDATLGRLIGIIGRTPLALRLGARLLADEDPALLSLAARRERIQAVLFHRVLEHIRVRSPWLDAAKRQQLQADLRQLVFPGLAVRRLTAGVIRHVLAKPCGVDVPDDDRASELFEAMRQQVDIVEPALDDDGLPCLLHRSDVRRMMLRDLEVQAGAALVQRIDRRAVAWHQRQGGLSHRAEEVYHRLRLQQTPATIRKRWLPGLERHLGFALDEMHSPAMQVLLAELLGVTLDAATLQQAAQADWEQQALRRARQFLQAAQPAQALAVLHERPARLPGSPLLLVQAEALHLLARWNEAAALAEQAQDEAAAASQQEAAAQAALQAALAYEGQGRLSPAHTSASRALGWTQAGGEVLLNLRARTTLLRLQRKAHAAGGRPRPPAEPDIGPVDEAELQMLRSLLDTDTLRELRNRPALLRELLAELGGLDERLLALGIEVLGVDLASEAEAEALARLLVAWVGRAEPPGKALKVLHGWGVPTPGGSRLPGIGDWIGWLLGRGARSTGALLMALLTEVPPSPELRLGLAQLYRQDSERRITRGVRSRRL